MSDEPYIWVNSEGNTNGSTGWVRSANAADAKKDRESFILEGEWTKDRYGVVYTGTGDNTEWNRVTVKALQVQELPNDASTLASTVTAVQLLQVRTQRDNTHLT